VLDPTGRARLAEANFEEDEVESDVAYWALFGDTYMKPYLFKMYVDADLEVRRAGRMVTEGRGGVS